MRSHSLNEGFAWEAAAGPFGVVTPEQARQYDELGYFVLEGALDEALVDELVAEIDPVEARREEWLREQGGTFYIARAGEITFSTHLVLESDVLRRFAASSLMAQLAADLIGPEVRLYWDQAVYKKPHTASPFPWHQDNGYAFIEPQQYLTCWIPLTDATVDNGCPYVVPRLHRKGTLAHEPTRIGLVCFEEAPESVAVPAARGSIVVFSSLTPHCTGPNITDEVRKAYIVQYAPQGAAVLQRGDDGTIARRPADDPGRQYPVVAGGRPLEAA